MFRRQAFYASVIGLAAVAAEMSIRATLGAPDAVYSIARALALWSCGVVFAAYFGGAGATLEDMLVRGTDGRFRLEGDPPTLSQLMGHQLSRLLHLVLTLLFWIVSVAISESGASGVTSVLSWTENATYCFFGSAALAAIGLGLGVNALRRIVRQ